MSIHPLAGKKVPLDLYANIPELISAYYSQKPDPENPVEQVAFGTSGHRGTSINATFNEAHITAIAQAICEYRKLQKIEGPLFLGKDTHALSEAALISALEVFAANHVQVHLAADMAFTPTPVISHAILSYNRNRKSGFADGVVITPSHNPPQDGGFKYNPPSGGPADATITGKIEKRANEILRQKGAGIKRFTFHKALTAKSTHRYDFMTPYISDLKNILQMDKIAAAKLKIGVDPLGGSGIYYWAPIAEKYHLDLEIVNNKLDPTFSFMSVDGDGKIRMDCSSPYAMAGLIGLKNKYDIAFGNDPDYDRHGIVTAGHGLLNPNHYLSTAIHYLINNRPQWNVQGQIGKTLVSSSMIDRVAGMLKRKVSEVPVGFKWFVDGLLSGRYLFGGEESAGASFLRLDGSVWTTDKDGFIMDLLAAEMMAVTGKEPGDYYRDLTEKVGAPVYDRINAPATPEEKSILKKLSPEQVTADKLAGEKISAKLIEAPGNGAKIGGLKVVTENGWFAARPSGTENIYKIYAESFKGDTHLQQIMAEARQIVQDALNSNMKKGVTK